MLRLSNANDFFEMDVRCEDSSDPLSYHQAKVLFEVCGSGFRGKSECCISAQHIRLFCRGLVNLEATRKGTAILLQSLEHRELSIEIRSVPEAKHFLVSGKIGRFICHSSGRFEYECGVAFGFEFDPDQLLAATKLPWVEMYINRKSLLIDKPNY